MNETTLVFTSSYHLRQFQKMVGRINFERLHYTFECTGQFSKAEIEIAIKAFGAKIKEDKTEQLKK